jgi:hypothetical protein
VNAPPVNDALIVEASDPTTPPTRIQEIFQAHLLHRYHLRDDYPTSLAEAIAANPNTLPDLLITLADTLPFTVAENPVLPLLPLELPDLLDHRYRFRILPLLRAGNLPVVFVRLCLQQGQDRRLAELAQEHIAVAGEADPTATDWEEEIFARLERLSPGSLEAIFEMVEYGLLPPALTDRLGFAAVHEPEDPERRAFAARLTRAKRLRARRAAGKAAPCRPAPSGGWNTLPLEEAHHIATDPDLPLEAMRDFAERGKAPMYRALVQNISATPDILLRCLRDSTVSKVIAHPNCDEETFIRALIRHTLPTGGLLSPHMTWGAIEERFQFEGEFLDYEPLARRLRYWHLALCDNPPQWPNVGLQAYLQTLGDASLDHYGERATLSHFLYLARLPQKHPSIKRLVAADEPLYRLAMALNPHLPVEWGQQLAQDGNRHVRVVAQVRLRDPYRPILGIPVLPLAEQESAVITKLLAEPSEDDFCDPFLDDDT